MVAPIYYRFDSIIRVYTGIVQLGEDLLPDPAVMTDVTNKDEEAWFRDKATVTESVDAAFDRFPQATDIMCCKPIIGVTENTLIRRLLQRHVDNVLMPCRTRLIAEATAGDTELNVEDGSTTGFHLNDRVQIGTGDDKQVVDLKAVRSGELELHDEQAIKAGTSFAAGVVIALYEWYEVWDVRDLGSHLSCQVRRRLIPAT